TDFKKSADYRCTWRFRLGRGDSCGSCRQCDANSEAALQTYAGNSARTIHDHNFIPSQSTKHLYATTNGKHVRPGVCACSYKARLNSKIPMGATFNTN